MHTQDENIPPVPRIQGLLGASHTLTPYLLDPATTSNNLKKLKSLRGSVFYHKATLQKSRSTVLSLKKENQQLQESLDASLLANTLTFQQFSAARTSLSIAQLELLESKKRAADSIFSSNAYLAWTNQEHAQTSAVQNERSAHLVAQNKKLSAKVSALQKRNKRSCSALKRSLDREKRQKCTVQLRMKSKGVYTPESRALMRTLVTSGCSQRNIGSVIKSVGSLMGVKLVDTVSRRSVRRALIEGGVASKIQVGYTIAQTDCESLSFVPL